MSSTDEDDDRFLVRDPISVIPRMNGKNFNTTITRDPAAHSVTIAGMEISEEEFYKTARSLQSEEQAVEHYAELADQQRMLQRMFGGQARAHGSSPFNPPRSRPSGKGELWDRFIRMGQREQGVIILLAQKIREAYMPHHNGQKMELWSEMHMDRQIKWIEMAVTTVRELGIIGLMRL